MRQFLDRLYWACGVLAGLFLILIAALILAQVIGRQFNLLIPSADDFAGFSMAASAFLGLAPTLRSGAHIRVGLLLGQLPPRARAPAELVCLAIGVGLVGYFTWYTGDMTVESWRFDDRSPGLISTPLWIPQLAMTAGLLVLAIALLDDLVAVLQGRTPSYEAATEVALESDRLGNALEAGPAGAAR
jgi:TRAP-type C4-dicarboxylate transport system permease small subunit